MIRPALAMDVSALCAIYNHYVVNTCVSFEEEAVAEADFAARVATVREAGLPYLVAEEHGVVVGYAYASRWKDRSAYRFCVEASVYLAPVHTGRGFGTKLYEALFAALRATPVRVVIGGIALPNEASVALHEKFGMRKVAHHLQVGYKFGQWIDVGYWQCELRPAV